MSSFDRIGVVGGGTMGAGIAEVCARKGCEVVVLEVSDVALDAARGGAETSLGWAVPSGRLSEEGREGVLAQIRWTTSSDDLADRALVIAAGPDTEELELPVSR